MKAARGPIIATNSTGCMEVVSTIYPYTAWKIPWIHTAFENVAANASGIESALKILKKKGRIKDEHVDVVAFAGDGGTFDIGIQALSGAVERGHDFLYVLYDNEAYMNTGIQRSGGTPHGAWTTTSPAGKVIPGKAEYKKPIADIMVAHPAFLHAFAPCPRGWRSETAKSVEIARLAVETCVFPLWEAEYGEYKLSPQSKVIALKPERKKPVETYLKTQRRFRHLFKPENRYVLEEIKSEVDRRWKKLLKACEIA